MYDELTVQDIKDIRGKYGLSQKAFAQLLGIGPASMVRYEQGATPSKANANLIRAAAHPDFMMECLQREGKLLTERQREGVSKVYYAYISLDAPDDAQAQEAAVAGARQNVQVERGEVNRSTGAMPASAGEKAGQMQETNTSPAARMNAMYDLTLRQEVLNEQAANIMGELISIKVSYGFKGQAGDVFNSLLDQIATMKPRIVSYETMSHSALDSISGYLKCADELLHRYQLSEVA